MKQQRLRIKLLALILFGLFALLAGFGLYSINAYGNRWFAYNRNPRIREQKRNVTAGDIYDRSVPSEEAVKVLDEFLTKMAQLGKGVFAVSGNHDRQCGKYTYRSEQC